MYWFKFTMAWMASLLCHETSRGLVWFGFAAHLITTNACMCIYMTTTVLLMNSDSASLEVVVFSLETSSGKRLHFFFFFSYLNFVFKLYFMGIDVLSAFMSVHVWCPRG